MEGNLELVLTPALLPLYEVKGKVVVVVDILRATTSICVAFQHGATKILPVSTPEEAWLFKDFDFLVAAERNALKVEGFDIGNSPFEFESPFIRDRNIAFTTTNGTKAIRMAKEMGAEAIVIGSFLNLSALCDYLIGLKKHVLILCAGWKDKFNLEDTLFAGAVIAKTDAHFDKDCDAALAALTLFRSAHEDLHTFVYQSSHAKRFRELHTHTDDVTYCLQQDTTNIIPILQGEYIVGHQVQRAGSS